MASPNVFTDFTKRLHRLHQPWLLKPGAYKRVGELHADARSAEAGSEILMLHREISGRTGQTYLWRTSVVNVFGTVCGQSVESVDAWWTVG